MQVTTKAIVISAVKFGEADLIAKCFTVSSGLKSYMLKNIMKSKKGLRPSFFQPLTLLEITANHKDKGTLEYMKEAKVYHPFSSIHTNISKASLVLFLSEILKTAIHEEEKNEELYYFLETSFIWLDNNEAISCFHLFFLLKLTHFLGFAPDTSTISNPVFNVQEGIFQKDISSVYCFESGEDSVLKQLLKVSYNSLSEINARKKERSACLDIILLYYRLHVQNFKNPKSLEVLHRVFS